MATRVREIYNSLQDEDEEEKKSYSYGDLPSRKSEDDDTKNVKNAIKKFRELGVQPTGLENTQKVNNRVEYSREDIKNTLAQYDTKTGRQARRDLAYDRTVDLAADRYNSLSDEDRQRLENSVNKNMSYSSPMGYDTMNVTSSMTNLYGDFVDKRTQKYEQLVAEQEEKDKELSKTWNSFTPEQKKALEIYGTSRANYSFDAMGDMTKAREELLASGLSNDDILKYGDYAARRFNKASAEESKASQEEMVKNANLAGKLALDATTIAAQPLNYLSGAKDALAIATGQPIDSYDALHQVGGYAQNIRTARQSEMTPVGSTIYGGVMSGLDNVVALNTLKAMGITGKVAGAIVTGSFSSGTLSTSYQENIANGMPEEMARQKAVTDAVIEFLTEYMPTDNLADALSSKDAITFGKMLKNIAVQMNFEGLEEFIGNLAQRVTDEWIAGEYSEYNKNVKEYGKAEADRMFLVDLGSAFAGGAIGGAVGGVNAYGQQYVRGMKNSSEISKTEKAADLAKTVDTESGTEEDKRIATEAKKRLETIAAKEEAGETVSRNERREAYEYLNMASKTRESQDAASATVSNEYTQDELWDKMLHGKKLANDENITSAIDAFELYAAQKTNIGAWSENDATEWQRGYELQKDSMIKSGKASVAEFSAIENAYKLGQKGEAPSEVMQNSPKLALAYNMGRAASLNQSMMGTASTSDKAKANLESVAETYTDKQTYINYYPADLSVSTYNRYMARMRVRGEMGASFEAAYNTMPQIAKDSISKEAFKFAYDSGKAIDNEATKKADNESKTIKKKGEGKVSEKTETKLNKQIKQLAEVIAAVEGTDIEFDATADEILGSFDKAISKVVINPNSDKVLQTLFHETFGEFTAAYNPEKMAKFYEAVLDYMLEVDAEGTQARIIDYLKAYQSVEGTKSLSEARDEFVNDLIAEMFASKEGMQDFFESVARVKGEKVATSIKDILADWLRDLANYVKSLVGGQKFTNKDLKMEEARIKELRAMLLDAWEGAIANYNATEVVGNSTEFESAKEFSDDIAYSIRVEDPPKKTGVAYKVFLAKNGQLYPPMVANPGGEGTPVGVWLNADAAPRAADSKTGRPQVQAGGKGTNVGKTQLAYRPGWHLGDIPNATQFAKVNPETGKKELFPSNFVWAECEYAMDHDYQDEAMSYGYNKNGKFQHSLAGLPKLPTDGYYRYRTNPNPDTVPWVITGAMKVNRLLTDAETDAICRENGVEPMARMGGPLTEETLSDFGFNQVSYSVDVIVGEKKEYGVGVILDTNLFDGLIEDERKTALSDYILGLEGQVIGTYTEDGDLKYVTIARRNDKHRKNGGEKKQTIKKLARYGGNETRQRVAAQIDEILEVSEHKMSTDDNSHGWLDARGWEKRTAYVQDLDGTIYKVLFSIAKASDQRNILYGISSVKEIDKKKTKGVVKDKPSSSPTIGHEDNVPLESHSVNVDTTGRKLSEGQKIYFANSKVVDENGRLIPVYHGSYKKFSVFDASKPSVNGRVLGDGFYFAPTEEGAKRWNEYGENVYEVYLNITNPFYVSADTPNPPEVEKYIKEKLGSTYDELVDKLVFGKPWWGSKMSRTEFIESEYNRRLSDTESALGELYTIENSDSLSDSEYQSAVAKAKTDTLKALGYDGIIYKKASKGFALYGGDQFVAFDPNQIKLTSNLNPTEDNDIRYSVEVDTEGRKLSENQKVYFANTKAVDEDGSLMVMYHGTVADFNIFDRSFGNVEGDWGKGFYYTNIKQDADMNYGSEEGADLTQKIERYAEQLEYDEEYEELSDEERMEVARKKFITSDPHTLEVYLNVKNPVYVREKNPTLLFADIADEIDYDEYGDDNYDEYYEAIDNLLAEKFADLEYFLEDNGYSDLGDVGSVLYQAAEEGGITLQDLKNKLAEYYIEDEDGNLASNEIARLIAEFMGYDGIIDSTVSKKFSGMKLNPDTVHIITFESNQAKRTDNLNPTDNADIRYSVDVSDEGMVTRYSVNTWTIDEKVEVKDRLIKAGYSKTEVDRWLNDIDSTAAMILSDRDRLDYEASPVHAFVKKNQEYKWTVDASTLCAKRRLYQGTFDAIQHALNDRWFTSDELIELRNLMVEKGHEAPCAVCYVESRRRHLGKFAQEWIDNYDGAYKPSIDELVTTDGLEALRVNHPQTYKDFMKGMNKKGSSNPKVVQLRTEYKGNIKTMHPQTVKFLKRIGGLRLQSFSDFETPHLLDMMQVVADMATRELTSQAYTKVPNFAWVFGNTGVKINLSLIAEGDGFDANGNLAFSSTEGMDFEEAMKIRDAYSENVGTIIVGVSKEHILACMADDRIDFIIPFHRSGWGMQDLKNMGLDTIEDFTYGQNEHDLDRPSSVVNGVQQYKNMYAKIGNLYPIDYWDYTMTGKENAQKYLDICARERRQPKFSEFLVDNGDGSYSLQPDGSTDGYWKLLIDFKMYDNDGKGAPQRAVQPEFNMKEVNRVLSEYEGGANSLPVAKDVVKAFVDKYKGTNPAIRYSVDVDATINEWDDDFKGTTSIIEEGAKALQGKPVNVDGLYTIAKKYISSYGSKYDAQKLTDNLTKVFAYLSKEDFVDYADFERVMAEVAKPVIEESYAPDPEQQRMYDEFKRVLKTGRTYTLSETQKKDIAATGQTAGAFTKANASKMNLRKEGGINFEDVWDELVAASNGVLDADTTESMMPIAVADALETLKPQLSSTWHGNEDEMARELSMQILSDYYGYAKEQELKDKFKTIAEAYRQSVDRAYQRKYDKLSEDFYEKGSRDAQSSKKIAELKALHKRQLEDVINEQTTSKLRESAKRQISKFYSMLEHPTDKKHVPEFMRNTLLEFLDSLDMVSHRAKPDSKEAAKWQDKMNNLARMLDQMEKGSSDDEDLNFLGMVMDPDLADNVHAFIEKYGKHNQISRLNQDGLKELNRILRGLSTQINHANETYANERTADREKLAQDTITDLRNKKTRLDKNGMQTWMRDFFNARMVDAVTWFEVLGDNAKSVFDEIKAGEAIKIKRIREAQNWVEDTINRLGITKDEMNALTGKKATKHTFNLAEGDITLTTAQIMELYAHMNREQSKIHILEGGIKAGQIEGEPVRQIRPVIASQQEIDDILSVLTDKQIALVKEMQKYLSDTVSEWGNNVTMKAYGYKKFTEKKYWPIKVDSNSVRANDKNVGDNASLNAVRNMSASKALQENANNAIILRDAFDTFSDHTSQMAVYEGLMLPIQDAMMWYNYLNKSVGEDERGRRRYDVSVKEEIERTLGRSGQDWFIKFMRDLNGEGRRKSDASIISAMTSKYKAAAVSANARVVVQQPTAIARAGMEMNPKYLLQAQLSLPEALKLAKKAQDNSSIAQWKAWGYFDSMLGKSMKSVITGQQTVGEKIQDVAAKGAQMGDDLTWGILYKAVELEVADTTNLKPGTKEFDNAVVKRFDDIIDHTQVVDSILHRTDLMRSKGDANQMLTAFMMEPSKSYNMIYRAICSGDKKKIARALVTYIINALMVSAAAAIIDAARNDDDITSYPKRWLDAFVENNIDNLNPIGQIPLFKEFMSAFGGYNASRMDVGFIYDSVTAIQQTYKFAKGTSSKTPYGLIKTLAKPFAEITGIPTYSALRELETLYNNFGNFFDIDNLKTSKDVSYDPLYTAIEIGENIPKATQKMLDAGKEKGTISSTLNRKYSKQLKDLVSKGKYDKANKLQLNIIEALVTAGYSRKEAKERIDGWLKEKDK